MMHKRNVCSVMLAALACIAVNGNMDANAQVSCPHPVDQKWEVAVAPAVTRAAAINVIVDGSGSMRGYFQGNAQQNHYRTLLSALPAMVSGMMEESGQFHYYRLGRELAPIAESHQSRVATANFYEELCQAPTSKSKCDIHESQLPKALDKALSAGPNELTIVLTDLFLSDSDVTVNATVRMRSLLAQLLERKGGTAQAIGILGLQTSFDGMIYDLPGQPRGFAHTPPRRGQPPTTQGQPPTTRAVYAVVLGPSNLVDTFRSKVELILLDTLPREHWRWSSFGPPPVSAPQHIQAAGGRTPSGPTSTIETIRVNGAAVETIRVNARGVDREEGLTVTQDIRLPAGTTREGVRLEQKIWIGNPKGDCRSWPVFNPTGVNNARRSHSGQADGAQEGGESDGLPLQLAPGGSSETLTVKLKHPTDSGMRPGYLYYVELTLLKARQQQQQQHWMREWSMTVDDAQRKVQERPPFFPTLNLSTIHDLLTQIERENQGSSVEPEIAAKGAVAIALD